MKRDMEAKIENEQLKTLAGQLNKVVNKKKEGEKEPEYVIVFPSNVNDFSQEASQQHNCVGWYYHNVLRGDCIIFFVRKASSPDESFITAEYNLRRRTISQFYYARNKAVTDKKLIELGHSVGKKIQAGIASKSITPIK